MPARLAFDELFLLQLGVLNRKHQWQESQPANPFKVDLELLDKWMKTLPFEFTRAQKKAISEILEDLKKSKPMSRLLQGEVGSGKTVVAVAALITAAANNFQGAFMAPTEILAAQHFSSICNLLAISEQQEPRDDYIYTCRIILPRR
jgi:ATP-dependent DNA helicase RecG